METQYIEIKFRSVGGTNFRVFHLDSQEQNLIQEVYLCQILYYLKYPYILFSLDQNKKMMVSLQQDLLRIMAENNLSPTNRKYLNLAQTNEHFMREVSKIRKESQYIDSVQLKKKISSIYKNLSELSQSEVEQWKEIHMIKIRQLASFFKQNTQNTINFMSESKMTQYAVSLREELHLMVEICRQMKRNNSKNLVEYNTEELADLIQQFYFKAYKEDILQTMEQVGYNTSRFRVLCYEQSSFFSIFCCWGPNGP